MAKTARIPFNDKKLVQLALTAQPVYPRYFGVEVCHDGTPRTLPSVGGITYNVQIGDSAFGWVADHIEPGVSLSFPSSKSSQQKALNHYACIGNTATLISGAAKGTKGVIVGHHGGVEHVMVDFPQSQLKKMTYDDKVLIESWGMGLASVIHSDITFHNIDPRLASKLFKQDAQKKIHVSVTTTVGGELMGSGLGSMDASSGDFDIQTADPKCVKKYNLDCMRLGDVVCIDNFIHAYGWSYQTGHVTFGVIVHGDSFLSGHGPGVATICSGPKKAFIIEEKQNANIGKHLLCGIYR